MLGGRIIPFGQIKIWVYKNAEDFMHRCKLQYELLFGTGKKVSLWFFIEFFHLTTNILMNFNRNRLDFFVNPTWSSETLKSLNFIYFHQGLIRQHLLDMKNQENNILKKILVTQAGLEPLMPQSGSRSSAPRPHKILEFWQNQNYF